MDKRTFLALLLTALVIVVTPLLFPNKKPPRTAAMTGADSAAVVGQTSGATAAATAAPPAPSVSAVPESARATVQPPGTFATPPADTTIVRQQNVTYALTPRGAAPLAAVLDSGSYRSLRPERRGRPVTIVAPSGPLLHYRLALGADTIALDTIPFQAERSPTGVTFSSLSVPGIRIAYDFTPSGYVTHVRGQVTGAASGGQLLIGMPSGLRSEEADPNDDLRHLSYGYKPLHDDVSSVGFDKLDSTVFRTDSGPLRWVSLRNKYFLVAVMAPDSATNFLALRMRGGTREPGAKIATTATATAVEPLRDGNFGFDLYVGPQAWEQLRAFGNDLENVHPYAGWLHGMVQPFATIVMRILLWMKATLQVNYGWVLILFGIMVRLLLWPLNQSAMRSSIKMQRLQPEMQALQKRYAKDPEKQRTEMIRLYQEHGMSPLSPLMGCLPMLLPMPVLFALYFVFQNTIEFRGVSFLWLPDLALKDPTYITPIFMGASMLLLSWIGLRGVPPTPQTKMMSYMMPAMMTVMFLNFPSGLNLYYAVQNVAAMPQQWMVAKERAKTGPVAAKTVSPPPRQRGVG